MDKKLILELLGRFFRERNLDLIKPYLHSNIIYATDGMAGEAIETDREGTHSGVLFGSRAFIARFKSKFFTPVNPLNVTGYYAYPMERRNKNFLLLKREKDSPDKIMALVEFKDSKIYYLHLGSHTTCDEFNQEKRKRLNIRMFNAMAKLQMKRVYRCIRKGANVNSLNDDGETLLTMASYACEMDYHSWGMGHYLKHPDHYLVERVKAYKKQFKGAGHEFSDSTAEFLLRHYIGNFRVLYASERIKIMKKLIALGGDLDHYRHHPNCLSEARNAMYYAIKFRSYGMVDFLVAQDVNLNVPYSPNGKFNALEMAQEDLRRMKLCDSCNSIAIEDLKAIIAKIKTAKQKKLPTELPKPKSNLEPNSN